MIELFWGCLIGGITFALASLLGGHHLHHGVHGLRHSPRFHGAQWLNPMTVVSAITVFGGAGILLSRYSGTAGAPLMVLAATIALVLSVVLHFAVIRPMNNSEVSTGFSMVEYVGKIGVVTVPIPQSGHGQVMITMGLGRTVQPASSFDHVEIPIGHEIVVVEVEGHALRVAPVES